MLRPKQILPLYNGARAWLVAGAYKGSSLDDSPESESLNFDDARDKSKPVLSRVLFNIPKDRQPSNLSDKKSESLSRAKSHSGKPLTDDSTHKAHAVHASFVDGFTEVSVPAQFSKPKSRTTVDPAASCRSLDNSSRILSTSAGGRLPRGTVSEINIEEDDATFANSVRKVGFAAAARFSDFRGSVKRGDGTSFMVHRAGRPCTPNSPKQKAKAESVGRAYASIHTAGQEVIGLGYGRSPGGRTGNKSGYTQKDVRKFSTCSEPTEPGVQFLDPLSLLNHGLSNMKIGTQMLASQTTNQEKIPVSGRSYKAESFDKQHSIVPCQLDACRDMTSLPVVFDSFSGTNSWQVNFDSQTALHGPSRHGESRRGVQATYQRSGSAVNSRQGRAGQRGFRNDGREVVEHVCYILGQLRWGPETEVALSELDRKLSPYHVNEVLKRQQDVGLASEFFDWAKKQEGFKHDVHTYTTMVGILGRAQRFDAVAGLLEDMGKDGCEPSVVTFNRLIHCYGRANQMAEALQIFHHMKRVGCVPDKVTYCTLIDLHAKAGFLDVAMDMYRQMQQAGLQPDTFTYSVIINCLGKAGELSAAQKILNEMIGRGCIPSLVTYNILIDLHAKSGKYDMALKLYNDMQETGFRPDQVTYSIVMEVLGHAGHLEEAEYVFSEMEEAGWAPDTTVYGLLVDMWGKAGNLGKACAWYNKMLESRVRPNVPTCNSLLGAFLRENLYDAGRQVLQDMTDQDLAPSLQTYTLLLSCYTMSERKADGEKIWSIMASLSHPAHKFLCSLPPVRPGRNDTREHTIQFFEIISREDQESKRSFTDATISFLHNFNMKAEAATVWEVAAENKIYPKAVTRKAAKYWAINLHTMSMGTAIIALSRTLSNLKAGMLATGVVPERIDIITGWGRRSRVTGSSLVKQAVEEILKSVSSPFRVENGNLGCFVGIGQPLADWLYESDMEQMHLI